jgi:hypothetical protein
METVYTEEPYQPRSSPYAHVRALPQPPPQQQVVVQQQRGHGVARATVWIVITIVLVVIVLVLVGLLIWLWLTRSSSTTTSGLGSSCTSNPCAVGLTCQLGTCKQQIGGSCTSDSQCPSATQCVGGECKSTWYGACNTDSQCAWTPSSCTDSLCQAPTSCTSDSQCFVLNGPVANCVNGMCNYIALEAAGQACTGDNGCLPPAVCQFGECVLPIGATGCSATIDCTAGSLCNDGTCTGCIGAPCTASSQCLAPYTCDTTGSSNGVGYCSPPATCTTDADCGLCSNGIATATCVGGVCTTVWT